METTTLSIHAPLPMMSDSHSEAIAITSGYDFSSAEEASARFSGEQIGNVYSRFTNPTVESFEQKLAIMEEAESCVAMSSGMSAYLAIAITFLKQGDHVVLASGIFSTTSHLFRQYFGQFGITATSVCVDDMNAWKNAMQDNTKLMVVESPTNPMMKVADLSALGRIARQFGALLIVDNTLMSPTFQKPLRHGADLVLHSTGKFIDGQGRCVGGAIAGSKKLISPLKQYLRSSGTCLSPFNAWIFSKGLDTLKARMMLHECNTRKIYEWLVLQPEVEEVYSTMDERHASANVIRSQQSGHTPIISFTLRGKKEEAWAFINALALVSRCTNIGDAKSMITHPASTTHGKYSKEEKINNGITDNLVRLCVGLEEPDDIIADIKQALAIACRPLAYVESKPFLLESA
ncbi:aminotransferase class I/II-fold pyridoxal phosphate-dependent enzyme [Methylobacter sp. Wu1]|uniref:aminotransferase class I/II-fold pyridoxal phosphate-dependent enzyme n=1 Tax=Methylobacter sp. Wu1 TaxID=3119359 RepID=UPI002F929AA6